MIKQTTVIVIILTLVLARSTGASPDDGHHADQHVEQARGPNGGVLLEDAGVDVELKIHETGIPPEYRAWISQGSETITEDAELVVELTRLGGRVDRFEFDHQGEYWLGEGVVEEPHSFDVDVRLTIDDRPYRWQWSSHEGRTHIADEIAAEAGIETAVAGPGSIERGRIAYGRLQLAPDRLVRLPARFPGVVTEINACLGDRVERGQTIARIESNQSLQTYAMRAPLDGQIVECRTGIGQIAGAEPLFVIADASVLWAELKLFPGQQAEVAAGQVVRLRAENLDRVGVIGDILPNPDGQPWTLGRVEVENGDGALAPGLQVVAEIVVERVEVPLVVEQRALQPFRDWEVVFIEVDGTYEIRPLELGRRDGRRVEVLDGLEAGARYVVENSYLIKADIEKSGASHDH